LSNDNPLSDPTSVDFYDYMYAKLLGSSLQVFRDDGGQVRIAAGDILSITVTIDNAKKTIDYTLFSKILNRPVTVEEINGTFFMETRLEDELEKEDQVMIGEDSLLAVDLLHFWAKNNGYTVSHNGAIEQPAERVKRKA
jgi:hypothetical protein